MSDDKNPNAKNKAEEVVPEPDKASEPTSEVLRSEESQKVLKEFDAFEVEDMPESNELQERRRKVKSRLQELDMEGVNSDAEASPFPDEEGGIMDLLREARLTPKQIFSCCGGLVFLAIVLGLIFGGWKWFGDLDFSTWFDSEEATEEDPEDETPTDGDEDPTYSDDTVWAGVLLGDPESVNTEDTEVGESIGLDGNGDENLEKLINDFSKIYESAGVDVNELLNNSSDRREALQDYMEELRSLLYLAERDQEALQEEMDLLSEQFSTVEDEKADEEERFFTQLSELDAYATTSALDSFVEYSQEVVRLRAHYLAREQLLSYFEQTIPVIETKLLDIELNEEALVKGVKVIDVDGSDLDLIIDESAL